MRRWILMGCLSVLAIATQAQSNGRVRSGTSLRWTMKDGSQEIMEGDLIRNYGNPDTLVNKPIRLQTTTLGNNHTTRVSSLKALCDNNAVVINWVAIQQPNADRYEIEQSADGGRTWQGVGMVPANRTDLAEASYNFRYNKNLDKVVFRVAAIDNTGERVYGTTVESPCHENSYRAISPNPVYSTTNLQLGSPHATKVKMLMVNNAGVVVQNRDLSLLRGTNQVPVDMSSLPQGYYTLFLQWNGGRQDVFKLLKR